MRGHVAADQFKWSDVEKKAARRAFDLAYKRQCDLIRAKVVEMAAKASTSTDLWKIHDYLLGERNRTDDLFDYRYSMLARVFGALIQEGLLHTDDLERLGDWLQENM
jgi:hypothetical protein